MTFRALALTAACFLAACVNRSPGSGGLGDSCNLDTDCADPYVCNDGRCAPPISQVCVPGVLSCNGNDVVICATSGDTWTVQESCPIGCIQGACVAPVCVAGNQRCSNDAVEECLPDGSAWATVALCPTSCETNPMDPNSAECTEPICSPFSTVCDPTPGMQNVIKTCNANGTGYSVAACSSTNPSGYVCVADTCAPVVCTTTKNPDGTFTRQEQCDGNVAQQCNDTGTGWETNAVCATACAVNQTTGAAACVPQVCAPFTTTCAADGVTLETCNALGTAYAATTCTSLAGPAVCVNGDCAPQVCTVTKDASGNITSRQQQCSTTGNLLQQCSDTETSWETLQVCTWGCNPNGGSSGADAGVGDAGADAGTGTGTPACVPNPPCQPGEMKCDQNALEECTPSQSGFGFVQYCPSGCVANTTTVPPTAACAPPICPPLNQQCVVDAMTGQQAVEICSADGTTYQIIQECSETCSGGPPTPGQTSWAGGVCTVNTANCTPGQYQCNGVEVQECEAQPNGTTQWAFVEHCLGTCVSGACSAGGSCGCDLATTTGVCGTAIGDVAPVTVNALTGSAPFIPCADGVSTSKVLVYTDPIVGADGLTVPDGTMVTFTNDFPAGQADTLIVSADADPTTPGIQRPTYNGVAIAVLAAPEPGNCGATGTRTVTVTAAIGGSCSGSVAVPFQQVTPSTSRTVFIAEDFSTTTDENRAGTTAQWNSTVGAVEALPAFNLGTGVDGALTVPANTTLDLAASGYAPHWNVSALTSQGATLDNTTTLNLVPGDEVLISTIWGVAGATSPGTYEFKTIASVSNSFNGQVTFTTPLTQSFGNGGGNTDLTNLRVVMQRVPQFTTVTIGTAGILTATPVSVGPAGCTSNCTPAGGTGILAFRATGTVSIMGSVSMDATGLPPNLTSYPTVSSTPSLNRLLLGPSGSAAGGGAIYVNAQQVVFPGGGTFHSNAVSGGGGGSVWVAGASLVFGGVGRLQATGGSTGRLRVDYSQVDTASSPFLSGAASTYVGQAGAVYATSNVLYTEPSHETPQFFVSSGLLFGVIGGSAASTVAIPPPTGSQLIPGVNVSFSNNGGMSWVAADSGLASFNPPASQASFQITLAPPTSSVLWVRGFGGSVTAK
jgi:hypothetical protein